MDIESTPYNDLLVLSNQCRAKWGPDGPITQVMDMVLGYWDEQDVSTDDAIMPVVGGTLEERVMSAVMCVHSFYVNHPPSPTPPAQEAA